MTATQVFQGFWWVAVTAYVFITATTLLLDRETARRSWFQGLLFPGLGALVVMTAAWFPNLWEERLPSLLGLDMIADRPHGLDADALLVVGARDGARLGGEALERARAGAVARHAAALRGGLRSGALRDHAGRVRQAVRGGPARCGTRRRRQDG